MSVTTTAVPATVRVALVAAVVVAVDRITKARALGDTALGNEEVLLGLVPTGGYVTTVVTVLVALLAAAWGAAVLVRRGHLAGWLAAVPLAGAASNLWDRVRFGAVVDWLLVGDVVVNLADVAILVGAAAVAVSLWSATAPVPSPAAER